MSRDGATQSCPKNGCSAPTTLAGLQNAAFAIALEGANLYWTAVGPNQPNAGQILQCSVAGCNGSPTTLATNQDAPMGLAVNANNLYWITGAYQNEVMKCATSDCLPTASMQRRWM